MSFPSSQAANLALTSRNPLPARGPVQIVTWVPNSAIEPPTFDSTGVLTSAGDSFVAILGPDFCGDESIHKFFESISIYGQGLGYLMVFVDGVFIKEATVDLIEDAIHSRLLNLPRGTKGYSILIILCLQGLLEDMTVRWKYTQPPKGQGQQQGQ